jgi:hypothetical protein
VRLANASHMEFCLPTAYLTLRDGSPPQSNPNNHNFSF